MTQFAWKRLPGPRRAVLPAALLAVLLVACGGRTLGMPPGDAGPTPDAAPRPDGRPDPWPDAGGVGCVVPPEPVAIHVETAPGFVMSLDRVRDRIYVLGGATGWGPIQAGLWILDGDTLEARSSVRIGAEMIWARYDPHTALLMAVTEADNTVALESWALDSDDSLRPIDHWPLCNDCAPAWSSPLVDRGRVAVAVRHLGAAEVQVFVYPDASGGVGVAPAVGGDTPHLIARDTGPFLLYVEDGLLLGLPLDWSGAWLADPLILHPDPAQAVLTATGGPTTTTWGAVLVPGPVDPLFRLLVEGPNSSAQIFAEVPGLVPYAEEMSLSDNGSSLGVAWGITFGAGQVGPHFMAVSAHTSHVDFGPTLIDDPLSQSSSGHSIWAATAPHPRGHAVVWGGWRETTYNGIYGKILTCTASEGLPRL